MRALSVVLLAATLGSGSCPASAAPGGTAESKVTLSLNGVRLRQAVEALCQGSGRNVTVDAAIPDVPVTLNLQEMAWERALDFLVRNAAARAPGVYWAREGEDYLIRQRPAPRRENLALVARPPMEDPGLGERVGPLSLPNITLRAAARKLFAGTGKTCVVERGVPDVLLSFSVRDASLDQAAELLVDAARKHHPEINVSRFDDVYVFHMSAPIPGVQFALENGQLGMRPSDPDTWVRIPLSHFQVWDLVPFLGGTIIPSEGEGAALMFPATALPRALRPGGAAFAGGSGGTGSYSLPYTGGGAFGPQRRYGGQ